MKEAGLELEDAQTISTPGVKQYPLTNRDFHTTYVGEIVDAYIITHEEKAK